MSALDILLTRHQAIKSFLYNYLAEFIVIFCIYSTFNLINTVFIFNRVLYHILQSKRDERQKQTVLNRRNHFKKRHKLSI